MPYDTIGVQYEWAGVIIVYNTSLYGVSWHAAGAKQILLYQEYSHMAFLKHVKRGKKHQTIGQAASLSNIELLLLE